MNTKLLIPLIGGIVCCSWILQPQNAIHKAGWLIGTWENRTAKGSIYERWTRLNDSEFSAKSYILKEKDTIILETISLIQEKGRLYYIPVVKNQNNGLPVRFTLKTISDTTLIFENRAHDFPQTISYTGISTDSLVAEIAGMQNGQEHKIKFTMKRIN